MYESYEEMDMLNYATTDAEIALALGITIEEYYEMQEEN